VWHRLDPVLWDLTHNPWVVLQTVSRDTLQAAMDDPTFKENVDTLLHSRRAAARVPAWFQKMQPHTALSSVAYFSTEFMLE
jgi:starch phosphorylase